MVITTKTTISFKIPDEYEKAVKFKEQHDWKEDVISSQWIIFTKEAIYSVEGGEQDG